MRWLLEAGNLSECRRDPPDVVEHEALAVVEGGADLPPLPLYQIALNLHTICEHFLRHAAYSRPTTCTFRPAPLTSKRTNAKHSRLLAIQWKAAKQIRSDWHDRKFL